MNGWRFDLSNAFTLNFKHQLASFLRSRQFKSTTQNDLFSKLMMSPNGHQHFVRTRFSQPAASCGQVSVSKSVSLLL